MQVLLNEMYKEKKEQNVQMEALMHDGEGGKSLDYKSRQSKDIWGVYENSYEIPW